MAPSTSRISPGRVVLESVRSLLQINGSSFTELVLTRVPPNGVSTGARNRYCRTHAGSLACGNAARSLGQETDVRRAAYHRLLRGAWQPVGMSPYRGCR